MEDRELVRLILDFAQEMNNLQLCYAVLLRRKGADSTDVFRRYREEADRIYTRCLTRRKRSCYYGISYPPFFCGITEAAEFTVEHTEKRAVVTVHTDVGSLEFQFNLALRKGEWRIDSFKQRYRIEDGCSPYQWQYGNF